MFLRVSLGIEKSVSTDEVPTCERLVRRKSLKTWLNVSVWISPMR